MDIKGLKDTIDWYDRNADEYSSKANEIDFSEEIVAFYELLEKPAKVLDVGCGNGRDAAFFHKIGTTIVGVDISKGLLSEARKHHPEIEFVEGDIRKLPFADAEFDGVWSHASLVHLETDKDVEQALTEYYRVLRHGGYTFIYVKKQSGDRVTDVVTDTVSNHDRFFRYYNKQNLEQLLQDVGFKISQCEEVSDAHGRPEVQWIKIIAQKITI